MWMTTGLYPQELTIAFKSAKNLSSIAFTSTGVKKVIIEGCTTTNGNSFKTIGETPEIKDNHGGLQRN